MHQTTTQLSRLLKLYFLVSVILLLFYMFSILYKKYNYSCSKIVLKFLDRIYVGQWSVAHSVRYLGVFVKVRYFKGGGKASFFKNTKRKKNSGCLTTTAGFYICTFIPSPHIYLHNLYFFFYVYVVNLASFI